MKENAKKTARGIWATAPSNGCTLAMALTIFALVALIGCELFRGSHLALQKFGWRFLTSSE